MRTGPDMGPGVATATMQKSRKTASLTRAQSRQIFAGTTWPPIPATTATAIP